jgi:hypothetical protein
MTSSQTAEWTIRATHFDRPVADIALTHVPTKKVTSRSLPSDLPHRETVDALVELIRLAPDARVLTAKLLPFVAAARGRPVSVRVAGRPG